MINISVASHPVFYKCQRSAFQRGRPSTDPLDHRSIGVNAVQALKSGWPASLPVSHEHFTREPTSRRPAANTQRFAWETAWPPSCSPAFARAPIYILSTAIFLSWIHWCTVNLLLPTQDALATAPTRPSKCLNGSGADNRLSALMTGHANHLPITGSRVVYVALNLPEHDRDNF